MKYIPYRSKKTLLLTIPVILLLAFGAFWFWDYRNKSTNIEELEGSDYINYGPPTEEEVVAGNTQSEEAMRDNSSTDTNASGLKKVNPYITSADKNSVNAYIPKILEQGGTCKATATNSATSETVTGMSEGFVNVSYTSCQPIKFSLTPGEWSVTVSYKSTDSEGSSESEIIRVD